jgi:hypothetical protein
MVRSFDMILFSYPENRLLASTGFSRPGRSKWPEDTKGAPDGSAKRRKRERDS